MFQRKYEQDCRVSPARKFLDCSTFIKEFLSGTTIPQDSRRQVRRFVWRPRSTMHADGGRYTQCSKWRKRDRPRLGCNRSTMTSSPLCLKLSSEPTTLMISASAYWSRMKATCLSRSAEFLLLETGPSPPTPPPPTTKKNPSSDLSEEGLLISNYLFLTLYFRVWFDLPGHC